MGIHRITCHFCSMQDYFGLSGENLFDSVHYDSNNVIKAHYFGERRLCPRGNFCVELAQHKQRVGYSLIDNEFVKGREALDTVANSLDTVDKSKIAILLSGSLTLEEAFLAGKLANKWGTKFVSQISPEDEIVAGFMNNFSFASLPQMQVIISVGDIFSLHPTMAKFIHDARFAERNNFLTTVDNCSSRTSRYAWCNLKASPGKVADLMEALAKAVSGEEYSIDNTGVDKDSFQQLVSTLRDTTNACVLFAPGVGRFSEPLRVGFWAKKLAEARKFQFSAFATGANGKGISRLLNTFDFVSTNEVISAIRSGDVEALLALGCDPIESFPGLYDHFKNIKFIATTATLPTAIVEIADVVIPSYHLFEKSGTILSLVEKLTQLDDPFP
ncbi:hypothetical protein DRQ33_05210, partial [bacterium]